MDRSREYFASAPIDEIGSELIKKVDDYYEFLLSSTRLNLWKRSYEQYNKGSFTGGKMGRAGQHGEFALLNMNHYRNLLQHLLVLCTKTRPALDPKATNTDTESIAQTKLAAGLLDYYLREKKVEKFLKKAAEYALIFGEGYLSCEWDATAGKEYGVHPETGAVINEGDLVFNSLTPLEVIRDFYKETMGDHDWYITKTYKNKFSLAAKYKDKADDILSISNKDGGYRNATLVISDRENDEIPYYVFFHKKTEAMPEGRIVIFLDGDTVLLDGPLPYRQLPIYGMWPEHQTGTCFGYTPAFDLLAPQSALDSLYSTVTTNQKAFGVGNVCIPKGSNINAMSLASGLKVIEYDAKVGKPEPLNLTATPPEVFNFMGGLEKQMEILSGISSVTRGQPDQNLKSGNALALMQSMSIDFSSGLIGSYVELMEDIGTAMLMNLRDYASVPRVAMIAGKSNRTYMKEFTGNDLNLINRVTVDVGNPLSKTLSGKVQMAADLLQQGMIKNPEEYIQVLTTGKLDPVLEGTQAELYMIREENEKFLEDQPVMAVFSDNHPLHVQEHKSVLSSTESRFNPQLVEKVLAHMMEHVNLSKTLDPALLQMMGMPVMAPPPPAGPMPVGAPVLDVDPIMKKAQDINMPKMPENPLTGNEFNNTTGGL